MAVQELCTLAERRIPGTHAVAVMKICEDSTGLYVDVSVHDVREDRVEPPAANGHFATTTKAMEFAVSYAEEYLA